MGKKPTISAEKRAQIVSLSRMKLSEREISWQMKVSKTAVHNAMKKFQNEGNFKESKRDQFIQGFPVAGMTVLSGR